MNLPVGTYTATIWVETENQSLGRWEALDPFASFSFKVLANKCGSTHTLEKVEVVYKPTCEYTGRDKYVCSVCDHVVYKETAKKDHEFKVKKWYVEPSHDAGRAGEALLYCVTCTEPNENIEVIPLSKIAKITTQPKSAAVTVGYRASFTAKATGEDLTYQWEYRNAGETEWRKSSCKEASYHVTSALALDGREFRCHVTDAYGITATSNEVTLTLPVAKITKQPKDVTVGYGEKAVVTIAATGDVLKYTWEYSNDGGVTWNPSTYTGTAYSQTMTVPVDGRMLRCTVTDKYGNTAHSNEVTLKIDRTELKITAQPKSVSAPSGEKAVISVTAVGDGLRYQWQYNETEAINSTEATLTVNKTPLAITTDLPESVSAGYGEKVTLSIKATGDDLTYQWYYRNAGAEEWSKSSCTAATYSVTLNAAVDGRQLYCEVDDKYPGTKAIDSTVTTLNLERTPLAITENLPGSVTLPAGEKAVLSIGATGDGLTYKWEYKHKTDSDDAWKTSTCEAATYSVTLSESIDGRQLRCTVYDAYSEEGLMSNVVTLNLKRMPLAITADLPDSITLPAGEKAVLSIRATGDGLMYEWEYRTSSDAEWKTSTCEAATYSQTLSESIDGRQLRCTVSDSNGSTPIRSNVVTLKLERTELAITSDLPDSVSAKAGEKVTLKIGATGDGLMYTWKYRVNSDSEWKLSSCKAATYSQTMSESIDGRQLRCTVSDSNGSTPITSNVVTLKLKKTQLEITSQPSSKTVAVGEKATFTVKATGDGLTYQWYYNSGSGWNKSSCTSASYSQTGKESVNGRQFYCVVTDADRNEVKTNTVTLTVK